MPAVVLPAADIGLYVDFEASRIELPAPDVVTPSTTPDLAFALFDGDSRATAHRGTAGAVGWAVTVEFGPSEQAAAVALMALFEAAQSEPDGRLQLRTTGAAVAGLDVLAVVAVESWTPDRTPGGGVSVTFAAAAVQYDVAE